MDAMKELDANSDLVFELSFERTCDEPERDLPPLKKNATTLLRVVLLTVIPKFSPVARSKKRARE